MSDGEDTSQTNPLTWARLASVAGVRIQTIGVGTAAGTTVRIDGFTVATAMDAATLKDVASVTNGSYHQAEDQAALEAISKGIDLHFTRRDASTPRSPPSFAGGRRTVPRRRRADVDVVVRAGAVR